MLIVLLACTEQPIEVEPEPPRDLQLEEGFHRELTRAYGCEAPTSGLFDATGSLAVSASEERVEVTLGQALDPQEDDICNRVLGDEGRGERWMTYTSDPDSNIRVLQDDGVRVYEAFDVVLRPVQSDYADPADYEPLALERLILGAIVLGGDVEELR